MKLTTADISALRNILNIADLIDIEALVIADGRVSGINRDKTALILSEENVPQLAEGSKLGLTRLKMLKSRLDLFATDPALVIEIKESPKKEATQLEFKGTNASVQFRATPVASIKYPKNVNDDIVREIIIQKDQAKVILDAGRVMGANNIAFNFKKKNEVVVEFTDASQDTFSISLVDPYVEIGESDSNVSYFVFATLAPLLKAAIAGADTNIHLRICNSSGLIAVNGHDIRLISQTDS